MLENVEPILPNPASTAGQTDRRTGWFQYTLLISLCGYDNNRHRDIWTNRQMDRQTDGRTM